MLGHRINQIALRQDRFDGLIHRQFLATVRMTPPTNVGFAMSFPSFPRINYVIFVDFSHIHIIYYQFFIKSTKMKKIPKIIPMNSARRYGRMRTLN